MEAVLAGLALGFGSGIAPGPLLALAIAVTLRNGLRQGLAVAGAPLITDTIIIALSLTVVSQLPNVVVAVMSIFGAAVVGWFAWENISAARHADIDQLRAPNKAAASFDTTRTDRWRKHPLTQAALVNLTNPAPWLFWITAGAPLLVGFADRSLGWAIAFLACFYVAIVGSKAALVTAIALGRHRLNNRTYAAILFGVGVLLVLIAVGLLANAIQTLAGA